MKLYYALAVIVALSGCAPSKPTPKENLAKAIAQKGQTRSYPAGLTAEQFLIQTDPVFAKGPNQTLLRAWLGGSMAALIQTQCQVATPQEEAALKADLKDGTIFFHRVLTIFEKMSEEEAFQRFSRMTGLTIQEFLDRGYTSCPPVVKESFANGKNHAAFLREMGRTMTKQTP